MDSYGAQVSRILHISDSWNSLRGIVIKPTVNQTCRVSTSALVVPEPTVNQIRALNATQWRIA